MQTIEQWLTLSQAAQRLNVSEQTMRAYADNGTVRCTKIGARGWRMFKPEDVEEAARARADAAR